VLLFEGRGREWAGLSENIVSIKTILLPKNWGLTELKRKFGDGEGGGGVIGKWFVGGCCVLIQGVITERNVR
jgi:hypothetical protein